ncbi:hypothetical protein SOCEGT47_025280 [Sorangium cellulosum]|uniref:Secreted protein n=1 Tax=Sorangium cellulosum TaxID=56 RepID=A0A4P2PYR4_SORCE|nr:hypothetical protein [Sorangium cellulosum]AUX22027.1 hypothetical protein SOCEGT47_025280 [Sorangium cellulosum]
MPAAPDAPSAPAAPAGAAGAPPVQPAPSATGTPASAGAAASPAVTLSPATGADTLLEEDEATDLRWRGSTFTWNQGGTTTLFGVGRDNIGGEDEFYGWDFTLRPNYYLLDLPKDKVTVNAEIGWVTELTNSNTTAYYREPQLKDTGLGVRYRRELWQGGGVTRDEYKTEAAVGLRVLLPTSPTSWSSGKYFALSLGPQIIQKIKLLGSKADGLGHVTATLGVTYAHLFAESYVPVNDDIKRMRVLASSQSTRTESVFDDQLRGASHDMDRLTTRLVLDLPLYKDLSLGMGFAMISRFKHEFEDECVALATGCSEVRSPPNPATYFVDTEFDVHVSHPVYGVVDVALGYSNLSPQLGEDGQRRTMFYSPGAQFYLDITANLDAIYAKVTGRGEKKDKPEMARAGGQRHL